MKASVRKPGRPAAPQGVLIADPNSDKNFTVTEWLRYLDIELDRGDIHRVSQKISEEYTALYGKPKQAYRKSKSGKHIAVGYAYNYRILPLIEKLPLVTPVQTHTYQTTKE